MRLSAAFLIAAASATAALAAEGEAPWRDVADGVEHAVLTLAPTSSLGDGRLHVVRIDPSKARLRALAISHVGGKIRTAREWREQYGLVAVINAGMFDADYSRHTGFFRVGEHVNSSRWVKSYQSILVFDPRKQGLPPAAMHDGAGGDWSGYGTVVQNLRLIRSPGAGVWGASKRRWSEAAIAMDGTGRILFLHSRTPYTMRELTRMLLALPLGIVRAMHVEGGPEASLSVHGNGIELNLAGSYETGFREDDGNHRQWPIPNVLGVEARTTGGK